ANGDVVACRMIPVPLGNVRRQTLEQIWAGQRMGAMRGKLEGIWPEPMGQDPKTWSGCKAVWFFGAPRDPLQGAVRELLGSAPPA
ncbi:MAG: SPASM domain-containing protein, partial [Halobacteriales archaeon]|nr:SPASM domain-containing protein [Halobacteriales archaeon]